MYLPMLATAWSTPFDDERWWFELKWDGYRCIVATEPGLNRLTSRRGLDLGSRFPEIAAVTLPPGWVLDGEVVVLDDEGRPDFSLLQAGSSPTLVLFDVLESPEGELTHLPWEDRRRRLEALDISSPVVVTEPIQGAGVAYFEAVKDRGLEGIVAKRSGSSYLPGRRSPDWRKIAARRHLKAVVGGWMPGEGARSSTFGSLLVGLWAGDELRWAGAVGSGFADDHLGPIRSALESLEQPNSPFVDPAGIPRGARWVEPALVVEVEFKEWTRERRLRAPVFKGMSDVPPNEVTWDSEGPL